MNSASLDESHIVLPSRSYYPFTVGLSLPFLGWAFIFRGGFSSMILLLTGVLILISSIVGWSLEPEYE